MIRWQCGASTPLYRDLVGVSATFWNPVTGIDEDVLVLAVDTNVVFGPVPNMLVVSGETRLSVAPSLLCEPKDGAAVPRFRFHRVALYNRESHRAIVYDVDGRRYEVEAQESAAGTSDRVEVAALRPELSVGLWVQPGVCVVAKLADDPYPFPKFQERVRDDVLWFQLIINFQHFANSGLTEGFRTEAATAFAHAEAAASEALWTRFSDAILNVHPKPGTTFFDVPITGRGARLVRDIAAKYGIPVPEPAP